MSYGFPLTLRSFLQALELNGGIKELGEVFKDRPYWVLTVCQTLCQLCVAHSGSFLSHAFHFSR